MNNFLFHIQKTHIFRLFPQVFLNGYIKVPHNHPYYEVDDDEINKDFDDKEYDCQEFGTMAEWTYSNYYDPQKYPAVPGVEPNDWIVGVDACHSGDMCPFIYSREDQGPAGCAYGSFELLAALQGCPRNEDYQVEETYKETYEVTYKTADYLRMVLVSCAKAFHSRVAQETEER